MCCIPNLSSNIIMGLLNVTWNYGSYTSLFLQFKCNKSWGQYIHSNDFRLHFWCPHQSILVTQSLLGVEPRWNGTPSRTIDVSVLLGWDRHLNPLVCGSEGTSAMTWPQEKPQRIYPSKTSAKIPNLERSPTPVSNCISMSFPWE